MRMNGPQIERTRLANKFKKRRRRRRKDQEEETNETQVGWRTQKRGGLVN
jgi:hypothetical protein